jgi:hypothetical protein
VVITGRGGLGADAHPRRNVALESSGSASFIGCRRIEREALRSSWRERRSGNGSGVAGQFANGRADCREDFAENATLAFAWTGLGRCATGNRRKAGTGARERRPTGLRAQPKRGCHRKNRGDGSKGFTGKGRAVLRARGHRRHWGAVRAQGKGDRRAKRLRVGTRYTQSSWASKPKRTDALHNNQQARGAARLVTISQCLKPC